MNCGCWHGYNAWILAGNKKEGYTLLLGGYPEEEAKKVKNLIDTEGDTEEYDDFIAFADPDEWKEQNF